MTYGTRGARTDPNRVPNVTRQVIPGETVMLEASRQWYEWAVYLRVDENSWSTRLGGWDPMAEAYAHDTNAPANLMAIGQQIMGTIDGPEFTPAALESMRSVSDVRRAAQTIWYNEPGRAVDIVTLDFGDHGRTTLDGMIASDEEYLEALQDTRKAATETDGIAILEMPDGRKETYRNLEAVDKRIEVVADRLARDKAARGGRYIIGHYVE